METLIAEKELSKKDQVNALEQNLQQWNDDQDSNSQEKEEETTSHLVDISDLKGGDKVEHEEERKEKDDQEQEEQEREIVSGSDERNSPEEPQGQSTTP